jgi:glycosyltransferase involved in cell wall biosynthesis
MDETAEPGLVSVIIPTFNRAHFLRDALQSVFQQTYRPVQFLIVDDGSSDDTRHVVESFAQEVCSDEKFEACYFRQNNHGAPTARNRGLIESSGEFIQFLDSDDILHPQKLEIQVHILQDYPDLDHTWSDFHWARQENFEVFGGEDRDEYEPTSVARSIKYESQTPSEVWSGLYRRSTCVRVGPWNETLERWQDLEYNFRLDLLSPSTAKVGAKLYKMRAHDTGRILDAKHNSAGINKGLHTLRVIERQVDELDVEAIPNNFSLDGLYFHLLQLGLEAGGHEQLSTLFDGVVVHSTSKYRRHAVRLLEAVCNIVGPKFTGLVLRTYSNLRGAR